MDPLQKYKIVALPFVLADRETVKKLAADPMFKLEHGVDDTKKLEAVAPTLYELEKTQTSWKDDFDLNRMVRQKFRVRAIFVPLVSDLTA